MEKANVIAVLLIAAIAIVSAMPSVMAKTEGAQLEFIQLYPNSLSYHVGEEPSFTCRIENTGTEVISNATMTFNILDSNGTVAASIDYTLYKHGCAPGKTYRHTFKTRWEIDENMPEGRCTIEAILRWGSNAIQRVNFFYVPIEKEQTTPGMEILSLYSQRLSYMPGESLSCVCQVKNAGTENITHYLTMSFYDQNGTILEAHASRVEVTKAGKLHKHIFKVFDIPPDAEEGIYTVEAIVWWDDEAVSKTCNFPVARP